MFEFEKHNFTTGETQPFKMTIVENLLISAMLSSSDAIAAVSIVNFDEQPQLFSIIFGEGIVNDAVAIILFNSVLQRTASGASLTWDTPLQIGSDFTSLLIKSTALGLAGGIVLALLLKHFRFTTQSIIH